jgi:hypothetical protein
MFEIRQALENSGGVDVMLFTAPCYMGAVEAMYEVRNQTDIYMGSENTSGYIIWKFAMPGIRRTLTDNPDISTRDLGREILYYIEAVLDSADNQYPGSSLYVTMSAVDCRLLEDLVRRFGAITDFYHIRASRFESLITGHYSKIENYDRFYVDLYSLLKHLERFETDPDMITRFKDVRNLMKRAVIAEYHGPYWTDTHGISLHFPYPGGKYPYRDDSYSLVQFAADTRWDEILREYLGSSVSPDTEADFLNRFFLDKGSGLFPNRSSKVQSSSE